MAGSDDVSSLIGAPELAPPAPAPAPTASASAGDPAVWTVLGEARPGDSQGQFAVASTIANRATTGGYGSYAEVVNDKANGYQAWLTPATQTKTEQSYPVGSPQYQSVSTMLDGLRSGQQKPLPYTYYHMTGMKNPPSWAQGPSTDIGGNTFYALPYTRAGGNGPDVASMIGAPELSGQPAAQPAAPVTVGPDKLPSSAAQQATMLQRRDAGLIDTTKLPGDDANPIAEIQGQPVPSNSAWVGLDGQFHPGPRTTVQLVQNALAGLGQGTGMDTAASGNRLGLGNGDPMLGAYGQTQGGPSALQSGQAATSAFNQQQQDYALRHAGEPEAQAGRFFGQAIPSTAAAALVPETKAPSALAGTGLVGDIANVGSRVMSNAFRGTAASATQVGANPDKPLAQQLVSGAVSGGVLPELPKAGVDTMSWLRNLTTPGRNAVPQETLDLARTAIDDFGIPIRGSQITGTVDRQTAIRDSNLISSNPDFARNNAQQQAAWNQALTKQTGADASFAAPSPRALDSARTNTGAIYNDLSSRYNIRDGNGLVTQLQTLLADAKGAIPAGELTPLENQIERVRSLIQPDGSITGAGYKGLTDTGTSLDKLAGSSGPLSGYAREFRDTIDSAFREGMTPADQARLDQANGQWKAIKAIEPIEAKAGPTGQISPASLLGRLAANKYTKGSLTTAATEDDPLVQLARIGSGLMKEPGQTNTTPRLLDAAKRYFGPAAFTGGAIEALHDPGTAAKLAVGAVVGKGVSMAANALTNYRMGSGAARAMVGSPSVPGAFSAGVGGAVKPLQIPLSALAGVRLLPGSEPVPAHAQ